MRLSRYDDLSAFSERALPFLMAREAEHCLPIGILTTLRRGEMTNPRQPYMALVEDNAGRVIETCLATPPFNLILSLPADHARGDLGAIVRTIAPDVRAAMPEVPGVISANEVSAQFAAEWTRLTGEPTRLGVSERIYRLQTVRAPRAISGSIRRIEETDRSLLREWINAFYVEALGEPENPYVETEISRRLRFESNGMYVWEAGGLAVSLAGYGGPTPHGIRIGPVYTPPEARGHGYASALVAALSQRLLDEGRTFVFLFTDLKNLTSNHIYQQIGYEAVGDAAEFRFARGE